MIHREDQMKRVFPGTNGALAKLDSMEDLRYPLRFTKVKKAKKSKGKSRADLWQEP